MDAPANVARAAALVRQGLCALQDRRMQPTKCLTCGAPIESHRCAYCGVRSGTAGGLVARPLFGAADGGWSIPSQPLHPSVRIERGADARALVVRVGSRAELGDAIVPAAWVPGSFLDVIAAMDVRFETPPCDAAAGFWLRLEEDSGVSVMCFDFGAITVAHRTPGHCREFAAIAPPPDYDPRRGVRLMASLIGDVIALTRDGVPVASTKVPSSVAGAVQARVQVGSSEACVVLTHPIARIPLAHDGLS